MPVPPSMFSRSAFCSLTLLVFGTPLAALANAPDQPLPFGAASIPLSPATDRSADMVRDLHRFFDAWTQRVTSQRAAEWKRDLSGAAAHRRSVEPQRQALRQMLGAVDPLPAPPELQLIASPDASSLIAHSAAGEVHAVRWPAFAGVFGEGLLLTPKAKPVRAWVVLIPDADQLPESLAGLDDRLPRQQQVARRLLASGCEVLIVTLLSRDFTHAGVPDIALTDQSHREWAWRPLFEAGRSLVGVEVRKVEAALAWFRQRPAPVGNVGVAGYGEGDAIAYKELNGNMMTSFDTWGGTRCPDCSKPLPSRAFCAGYHTPFTTNDRIDSTGQTIKGSTGILSIGTSVELSFCHEDKTRCYSESAFPIDRVP